MTVSAVELNGINQPITLYIALADFRSVFVSKEDRDLKEAYELGVNSS